MGILSPWYSRFTGIRKSIQYVRVVYEPVDSKQDTKAIPSTVNDIKLRSDDVVLHMGPKTQAVVQMKPMDEKTGHNYDLVELPSYVTLILDTATNSVYSLNRNQDSNKPCITKEEDPIRWYHWAGLASYSSSDGMVHNYVNDMYDDGVFNRKVKDCLISPNEYSTSMNDIIGHNDVKQTLKEMSEYATVRPDLFQGIRAPARGILLYGPPGNGKTMLAQAMASNMGYSFLNISASSTSSHWQGSSQKLMRAVFRVAKECQPCVIFFDEIDSTMKKRTQFVDETSTKVKTEFMVGINNLQNSPQDRIIVVAATNTPHLLDEAVLRRFPVRVFIDAPKLEDRQASLRYTMRNEAALTDAEWFQVAQRTRGFSHSDLHGLCTQAGAYANREQGLTPEILQSLTELPKVQLKHFMKALEHTRPSVSTEQMLMYRKFKV